MHDVLYACHYGYQKTIETTKKDYYWSWLKKEIVDHIDRFFECEKVKFEHRHPTSCMKTWLTGRYRIYKNPHNLIISQIMQKTVKKRNINT